MLAERNPSLTIAGIYFTSSVLGNQLNWRSTLSTVMLFCMSLVGLALAHLISRFEPLPVTRSILQYKRPWRNIAWLFGIALLVVPIGLVVSSIGQSVGQWILGEPSPNFDITTVIPPDAGRAFFAFLAGSGIAEETIFRLVLLSFLWRWTKRPWLAVVLSSLIFGAYHLTPLNRMYLYF